MAANLSAPPITGEMWLLADWVEFQALCDEFEVYRLHSLIRVSDENQDIENQDFTIQDNSNEQLLEKLLEELSERQICLKESYPFEITGTEIAVKQNLSHGCYAYFYCLFFTHVNRIDVITESSPNTNPSRDLMQVCSTFAAAGFLSGNAISFGFPRPDSTNFQTALKNAYAIMGEGKVSDTLRPGASAHEKDGEIDIIAWGRSSDETVGSVYMLGQVASGANWSQKSVKGAIEHFHDIWFDDKPPSTPMPAMFIPFCIDKGQHSLRDVLLTRTYKFGKMFFRYNIPNLVDDGFSISNEDNTLHIERKDDFENVIRYVDDFRQNVLCPH